MQRSHACGCRSVAAPQPARCKRVQVPMQLRRGTAQRPRVPPYRGLAAAKAALPGAQPGGVVSHGADHGVVGPVDAQADQGAPVVAVVVEHGHEGQEAGAGMRAGWGGTVGLPEETLSMRSTQCDIFRGKLSHVARQAESAGRRCFLRPPACPLLSGALLPAPARAPDVLR